jgi:hypothetical protein
VLPKFSKYSMAPAKFKRHLHTKQISKDNLSYVFKHNVMNWSILQAAWHKLLKVKMETSTKWCFHVVRYGEAHSIAENLIKPCLDDNHLKAINLVSLLESIVSRWIKDVSCNMKVSYLTRLIRLRVLILKQINRVTSLLFLFCLCVVFAFSY